METVAIVGVGLIGGSFGLAIKAAGFPGRVLGVSSPRAIEEALRVGAIDAGATLDEAASEADLLYLSQPISGILDTLPKLTGRTKPGALITDAGSTKRAISSRAAEALPGALFVGGHPMAGKESRGAAHADANLFRSRPYLLTTADDGHHTHPATQRFLRLLAAIGARVEWMTPDQHDRIVAAASHGPQMLSTALSAALSRRDDASAVADAAGPGLTDMTRLALSNYDIWRDILATNGDEVASVLAEVEAEIARVRATLSNENVRRQFADGAAFAALVRRP